MKFLLSLFLALTFSAVAQPIQRNSITTNLLGVAPDGWFLVWSNNIPVATLNIGAATNGAGSSLVDATNNDIAVSNNLFLEIVSSTNNALALATNNDTAISNALYALIQALENPTNNDMAVSNNLYLEIVSATNNSLLLATNNDLLIGANATNNDTVISNGVFSAVQASTNASWITTKPSAAELVSATNNALLLATNEALLIGLNGSNNVMVSSNNLFAGIVSATNNALTLSSNFSLQIGLGATNESLLVGLNASNNVMVASNNIYADIVSATNNALTLSSNFSLQIGLGATNQGTVVSNGLYPQIVASTNASWITTKPSAAELVSATNNALFLATNNDNLISANATNNDTVVSNGLYTQISAVPSSLLNGTNVWTGTNTFREAAFFSNSVAIISTNNDLTKRVPFTIDTTFNYATNAIPAHLLDINNAGTNKFYVNAKGNITVGSSTNLFATTDIGISHVVDRGETTKAWINIASLDTWPSPTAFGEWWANCDWHSAIEETTVTSADGTQAWLHNSDTNTDLSYWRFLGWGSRTVMQITPMATADGAITPYLFDTYYTIGPTVPVLNFKNNTTNLFKVMGNGDAMVSVGNFTVSNLTASRMILSGATKALASAAASGAVPIDADGSATTFAQVQALAPGVIMTNGGTTAITYSNNLRIDIAHSLSLSNLTTARMLMSGADSTVGTAAASGAVPVDADGSATTFAQVQALAPGVILTNGGTTAITYSNNFKIDIAHSLSLSNVTASRLLFEGGDSTISAAAASGAVPIDADGSATTAAQIAALVTINSSGFTNKVNTQSANYAIATTDYVVLLTGAHTATLPTAVGAGGKSYVIKCTSAGTNAILTTSAQTIDGAAKWTNTAVGKFTAVISDNANWWVIGQN